MMNPQDPERLWRRIEKLERRLRFSQAVAVLGVAGALIYACAARPPAADPGGDGVLRARALVIEDGEGRDRIVLGAPVPDPADGERISPSTGMVINDPSGAERFGLGLKANGDMSMGFDAPVGTGDERNRERLSMGADGTGGAYLRFLDRRTLVPLVVYTDEENRAWLELWDYEFEGGEPRRRIGRRLGVEGWSSLEQPMQPN